MKNERQKYQTPVVDVLEILCEPVCGSQEDYAITRSDYQGIEWH